ncbi:MAG: hypothetical protein SOH81_00825 [Acetobacter sp.]|jgi:hypothetical protein
MAQGRGHFSWEPRELDTFFSGNKPKIASIQNQLRQTENKKTESDAALSYVMGRSRALKTQIFFRGSFKERQRTISPEKNPIQTPKILTIPRQIAILSLSSLIGPHPDQ